MKLKTLTQLMIALLMLGGACFLSTGCTKEDSEKAVDSVEEAGEDAADATKDAAEEVGDAVKDATN